MKIKINELTWRGVGKLAQLSREMEKLKKDKEASFIAISTKELEILKLITDINSKYATKKQMGCEL